MALQPRVDALEQVAYDSERLALIRNLPDPKRKETLKALAERGGTVNSEVQDFKAPLEVGKVAPFRTKKMSLERVGLNSSS